jgi:hypothetical protein
VDRLPHDCFAVHAIQAPPGGVLVLSPNALLYFDQTQRQVLC